MNLSPRSSGNNDREDSKTSGSDFSETERGREAKCQHRREYNRLHSPTADELEEDDLQAEQDYIQETEVHLPPQPKGHKGKAHRPARQEHDDDDDEQAGQEDDENDEQAGQEDEEDDEQPNDEDEGFQHRSGPFPNQSRTRLTPSIETTSLPWRTLPILVASLLKHSSDL